MIDWKTLVALAVSALATQGADAAPTAAEAARLGKDLTPVGAEKAGNKEGTIPAWTGGLCSPPAGYKPANGKNGFPYVDPFAAEKPIARITADNLSQWADKLDRRPRSKLFKRFPATYRMDVYPTHRTACHPDWVYENTIKRVMNPKLVGDAPGLDGAHAQVPFPIPKTGQEAMWNSVTALPPASTTAATGRPGWSTPAATRHWSPRRRTRYHWEYWDNSQDHVATRCRAC